MNFYDRRYGQQASFFSSPTIILIIVNVLVFAVLLVGGDSMYALLAQEGDLVFQGFYWQLFTSMFVHFDILHIVFNMFALYYFGRMNESYFSAPSYLAIYFGSGLLGNVVSLYLLPQTTLSGGASGAIFGLVGSYVAIARKARHMGVALLYAVMMLAYSGVGVSGMSVNNFAHVFGFVGGLGLGLVLSRSRSSEGYSISYNYG